jgi:hypothetical protein
MYPSGPLKLLAARKARLRDHIGRRRETCVAACHRLAEPLEKIDVWRARLHRFGPYMPWGLALFGIWRRAAARPAPRTSSGAGWIRWLPVVFQGVQLFRKANSRSV